MSSNYNNNNNNNIQRRPQTLFNDYRYPMPATRDPIEGGKYPARWTWEFGAGGKIIFKVNDGNFGQSDRNAKSKEVPLSIHDRGCLFGLIREACDNPSFTKAQYHVKQVTFGNNGRLNDHASTLGTFTVTRSADGRIGCGYSKGTYKVPFEFISPFESCILVAGDGEAKQDPGLMSRLFAISFITHSAKFLDAQEFEQYKPRERRDNGNNNNNGGNGGGNNNNSNYNNNNNNSNQTRQQPAGEDFDLDF